MKKAKPRLCTEPVRRLTDRECASIIGGLIGGLAEKIADVPTVRRAVQWWASNDAAWEALESGVDLLKKVTGEGESVH